ncbi:hypothetical protein BS329_08465 [Amycolatopsis coloradensis]|uniref:Uncharacterized protein n=1 Tax=Amycolatopsis coloradensis TaxID=76021 RepID=A0A1R0KYX4_9PSEU|nr:hypothetical protein [Amycolatopsis coloradensis]OLZ54547.1 hypothetical protein BS329_08465 [Amycolatopsis coloradensis]
MRRRIALALGGGAVLTASLASAALAPVAQASPGLIAAMQRDLGLTAAQAATEPVNEILQTYGLSLVTA